MSICKTCELMWDMSDTENLRHAFGYRLCGEGMARNAVSRSPLHEAISDSNVRGPALLSDL